MSGPELAIFGAIAAAIQLSASVVQYFGIQPNTPYQVLRLQRLLDELNDEELVDAAQPKERERIQRLVEACVKILSEGKKTSLWTYILPRATEERLREQNDGISGELTRLQARVHFHATRHRSPRSPTIAGPSSPAGPSTGQFSPFLSSRRASSETIDLPCTLSLQDNRGNVVVGPLKLRHLTILERDSLARYIQYQRVSRRTGDTRVTHRIPRGRITFEDDNLADRAVSFLDAHEITVHDEIGGKVCRLYPVYRFETVAAREEFLHWVRERFLLGRFYVEHVWHCDQHVARQQVVRIWRKDVTSVNGLESCTTTLSFLGRDGKPYEFPMLDFFRIARLSRNDSKAPVVELLDLMTRELTMVLEFRREDRERRRSSSSTSASATSASRSQTEAEKFKTQFELAHPGNAAFEPTPEITEDDEATQAPAPSPILVSGGSSTTTSSLGPSLVATSPMPSPPDIREDPASVSSASQGMECDEYYDWANWAKQNFGQGMWKDL